MSRITPAMWGFLVAVVIIYLSWSNTHRDKLHVAFKVEVEASYTEEPEPLPVPSGLEEAAKAVQDKLFAGKETAPVMGELITPRLTVSITSIDAEAEGMRVVGTVKNTTQEKLTILSSAFRFKDSKGNIYATSEKDATSVELPAGSETSLDLGVPIKSGVGLTLFVVYPPDPDTELILTYDVATPEAPVP